MPFSIKSGSSAALTSLLPLVVLPLLLLFEMLSHPVRTEDSLRCRVRGERHALVGIAGIVAAEMADVAVCHSLR